MKHTFDTVKRAIVVGLAAWLCYQGHPVKAAEDDPKAAAKAKLAEGARLMDAGDYAQALADFEEAYKLVPNAKILFNVGLADTGLARYPDAMVAFEAFVAEAKNVSPTVMAEAQKQIESLRAKVASVEVQGQAGIEIIIDGRSRGRLPLTAKVYVEPGEHRLVAQRSQSAPPVLQVFTVAGGEHKVLPVAIADAAVTVVPSTGPSADRATTGNLISTPNQPAGDQPNKPPVYKKAWFWGVIGAGVVAAGLAAFLVAGRSPAYPDASLGSVKVPPQ